VLREGAHGGLGHVRELFWRRSVNVLA
jgi:hypothetical protein